MLTSASPRPKCVATSDAATHSRYYSPEMALRARSTLFIAIALRSRRPTSADRFACCLSFAAWTRMPFTERA